MGMERTVRMIAGTFILVSLALAYWVSHYWLLFTAFVGANLLQSAFTQICPLENILDKIGIAKKTPKSA